MNKLAKKKLGGLVLGGIEADFANLSLPCGFEIYKIYALSTAPI